MKWKTSLFISLIFLVVIMSIPSNQGQTTSSLDGLHIEYDGVIGQYNSTSDEVTGDLLNLTVIHEFWKADENFTLYNFYIFSSGSFTGSMNGSVFDNRTMWSIQSTLNLTFSDLSHTPFFILSLLGIGDSYPIAVNDTDYSFKYLGETNINILGEPMKTHILYNNDTESRVYYDTDSLALVRGFFHLDDNISLYIILSEWSFIPIEPPSTLPFWIVFISIFLSIPVILIIYSMRKRRITIGRKKGGQNILLQIVSILQSLWRDKTIQRILIVTFAVFSFSIFVMVYDLMRINEFVPRRFGMHDASAITLGEGDVTDLYYTDQQYVIYNGTGDSHLNIWVEFPFIDLYRNYEFTFSLLYEGLNDIESIEIYVHNDTTWFEIFDTKVYTYYRLVSGFIEKGILYTMVFNVREDYLGATYNTATFEQRYDSLLEGGHGFTFLIAFQFKDLTEITIKIDQCILNDLGSIINPLV